jgi:hypothetical protein
VPPLPHVVVPGRRDDPVAVERPEDPVLADQRFELGLVLGPPRRGLALGRPGAERARGQVGQGPEVIPGAKLANLGLRQLSFSMISSETE